MKFVFSLIAFVLGTDLYAQTGGLSYVESIEKKAKTITENKERIRILEKELLEGDDEWDNKIAALKKEIKDLETERDNILDDMKKGARCSECNNWKTEIEKSGKETFEQHVKRVTGYAIPASTSELEAVRVQYREKIAYKKVMLKNAEKQNPATQKKQEIDKLKASNETLCTQITADIKSYETTVFKNAKTKHKTWFTDIMNAIAEQHIAQDGNTLYNLLKTKLTTKYNSDVAKIKTRHKQEIETEKQRLNTEKIKLQQQQSDLLTTYTSNKKNKEQQIQILQQNIIKLNAQLSAETNDSLKAGIQTNLDNEKSEIVSLNAELKTLTDNYNKSKNRLQSDILDIDDELWKLQTNVTVLQGKHVQELATLRVAHERAIDDIKYKLQNNDAEVKKLTDAILSKKNEYKKANINYVDEIVSECNRMLIAVQPVSCTVHNEIRFMVAQNYNKQESCVLTFTAGGLGRSFPSSGLACLSEYPAYVSKYKSFANGLSDEQKEAVKGSTFYTWYNAIMSN